jgi:hypothetical protein
MLCLTGYDYSVYSQLSKVLGKVFFPTGNAAVQAVSFWGLFAGRYSASRRFYIHKYSPFMDWQKILRCVRSEQHHSPEIVELDNTTAQNTAVWSVVRMHMKKVT